VKDTGCVLEEFVSVMNHRVAVSSLERYKRPSTEIPKMMKAGILAKTALHINSSST